MATDKQVATGLRNSAEHFAEQVERFIRLTALAAIPSVWNLIQGGHFDWRTLLAFVVPFAEVAFRQIWPAVSPERVNTIFAKVAAITKPVTTRTRALTGVVRPPAKKAAAKKTAAKKTVAKKTTSKA